MNADAPRLVFDPPAEQWAPRLLEHARQGPGPEGLQFRRELGLPVDRPMVMSGHQATIWHAGILAKALASEAIADAARAACVWLVVDQDSERASEIRHPYLGDDGVWSTASVRLRSQASDPADDVAACSLPAQRPPDPHPTLPGGTPECVRSGITRVLAAFDRHSDAPDAAQQAALATSDLIADIMHPPQMIFASSIARTSLFRSLIDRMVQSPEQAALAYNRAVAQRPHVGIAPLKVDEVQDLYEMPLWAIEPGKPRRRVYAHDLGQIDHGSLAPRALLMTGILRWAACDLFVHGVGGGHYDPITEQWLGEWLGATLAPGVVASADVLLPIQARQSSPQDLARARWVAHHARHDPGMLGEPEAAAQKAVLVQKIDARRDAGEDPLDDYRSLHKLLEMVRLRRADQLDGFNREVTRIERELAGAAVAQDRTWPFPLHEPGALLGLRRAIRRSFNAESLAQTPASTIP